MDMVDLMRKSDVDPTEAAKDVKAALVDMGYGDADDWRLDMASYQIVNRIKTAFTDLRGSAV